LALFLAWSEKGLSLFIIQDFTKRQSHRKKEKNMKAYLAVRDFSEIAEIEDINTIHITQEVRDRCADNYCGFYGKNHMCPPAVGDLSHYQQLIQGYAKGLVFSKAYPVKNRYDYKSMVAAGLAFRETIQEINKQAKADQCDCTFFSAGTCGICESCSIQIDEPCRFPEDAIPSLEAAGIDVVSLSRSLGMTYNNGADKVTYFGLVVFDPLSENE
jgi:predicted metal-binding protein